MQKPIFGGEDFLKETELLLVAEILTVLAFNQGQKQGKQRHTIKLKYLTHNS